MSQKIQIKGIREGLLVTLGDQPWDEVHQALLEHLDQQAEFLRGARLALDVGNHVLKAADLGHLSKEIADRDLILWAVISSSAVTERSAQSFGLATRLFKPRPEPTAPKPETTAQPGGGGILVRRTLRSGASLQHPGHVVVIGDINPGAEIIARTIKGSVCGFSKKLGMGNVIHLGTWLGFDTEGHRAAYMSVLEKSGGKLRYAHSDNENIMVRERFAKNGSGLLFIGNYFNEEHPGRVNYTHPLNGDSISIPYHGGSMLWPALYGVISPLCLEVTDGLKILHCTSEILDIKKTENKVIITLYGDRDLQGEIVFEGEKADKLASTTLNGVEISTLNAGKRIILKYPHANKAEMILCVKL